MTTEDLTPECVMCGRRTLRWVDGVPMCASCDAWLNEDPL